VQLCTGCGSRDCAHTAARYSSHLELIELDLSKNFIGAFRQLSALTVHSRAEAEPTSHGPR
jgi:hypothetical protein